MAEARLRVPDLGAQLGASSCLEKWRKSSLSARRRPFSGKSFYLDLPAGKNLKLLTAAIQQLVGVIEGFLSREVSYIVSSRREAKAESNGTSPRGCPSPSEVRVGETPPLANSNAKGSHVPASEKAADPVPTSRGKELLRKAIRNQGGSSRGGSGGSNSLLANARSWGVRILHVDEMLLHLQQLSPGALRVGEQKPEGARPAAEARRRKVARLKVPFLKIEDKSRKFRPFYHQFKSFPEIYFLGPKDTRSPFEAPTTPGSSYHTRDQKPSPESAACRTFPKKRGYCECCQQAFEGLRLHLQSAQHQGFVREANPYTEVDRIVVQLSHNVADVPFQANLPQRPRSLESDCDPHCPETPLPRQPPFRLPRTRKEGCQDPGMTSEQNGTVGSVTPAAPSGTGGVLEPGMHCQECPGSVGACADSPGTLEPQSPSCQYRLDSSAFAYLPSGPDPPLLSHKRKVPSSSGNAEKQLRGSWPQASTLVLRTSRSCGPWTLRDDSLPALLQPDCESRPLATSCPCTTH